MGNKQIYTKNEQETILRHVAGASEGYHVYSDLADRLWPGERKFTPYYYKIWINRRRDRLREMREEVKEEVKKASMLNKVSRIEELEESVRMLNDALAEDVISTHLCDVCEKKHSPISAADLTKLLEQKRRTLESIAKERNEWLKDEKKDDSAERDGKEDLRIAALRFLNREQEKQENPTGT